MSSHRPVTDAADIVRDRAELKRRLSIIVRKGMIKLSPPDSVRRYSCIYDEIFGLLLPRGFIPWPEAPSNGRWAVLGCDTLKRVKLG